MIKIFQISSELNSGSVGRIAHQIGEMIILEGWESHIAYGRDSQASSSASYKIGSKLDIYYHALYTRLTDKHGFASKSATQKLIKHIKDINPNIIQLHHVHGYFINIKILFDFLANVNIPVVWIFHDCWSFTGHCIYYEYIGCQKWQLQCQKCPQIKEYPKSYVDNSFNNYITKKQLFNSIKNLTIVPVSNWLGEEVKKSFLKNNRIRVIQNGIDLGKFTKSINLDLIKKYKLHDKFVVLGVASPWVDRKGLYYFLELSKMLDEKYQIILIGLNVAQIKSLPSNVIGLEKIENIKQLAEYYTLADVFVNPTLDEALGMTSIEAQSCGTPVVTFNSGGSPETISVKTGIVVEKGNLSQLYEAILEVRSKGKKYFQEECIKRAEFSFNNKINYRKYIELYKELLN